VGSFDGSDVGEMDGSMLGSLVGEDDGTDRLSNIIWTIKFLRIKSSMSN